MSLKTLDISADLRENINYNSHIIPMVMCTDLLDDYANKEWQCHWHEEFEFTVVTKGSLTYQIFENRFQGGTTVVLKAGDGIFINSGRLHSVKALEPQTKVACFVLPSAFFDGKAFENFMYHSVQPILEAGISHKLLPYNEQNRPVLVAIADLCNISPSEFGYELHTIEMVCRVWRLFSEQLLAELPPPDADKPQTQRLKKALAYIHAHFNEAISVEDILNQAAISRSECFRIFQQILGKSPIQYLNEYRLANAAMLLANSQRTLSDIAFACGFQTPSYFGKQFRKQYGVTPKTYRERTVG